MFRFRKKKEASITKVRRHKTVAFAGMTYGGWIDQPQSMSADGGVLADAVEDTLANAREYAKDLGFGVGDEFVYSLYTIPRGVASEHEINTHLKMRASEYGLKVLRADVERATMVREN